MNVGEGQCYIRNTLVMYAKFCWIMDHIGQNCTDRVGKLFYCNISLCGSVKRLQVLGSKHLWIGHLLISIFHLPADEKTDDRAKMSVAAKMSLFKVSPL